MYTKYPVRIMYFTLFLLASQLLTAQTSTKPKYESNPVYAGVEVGSKGVKLSLLEVGKDSKTTGSYTLLKDTTINTDFISFTDPTFHATLDAFTELYNIAFKRYNVPQAHIFAVISSGVKMQAEKEEKAKSIDKLIDSFRIRINDPRREVDVIDVADEARLSHLGIVPKSKRFSTFLIDIGSGNSKGGYFPIDDDLKTFKLFELNWGTKSTANAATKRLDEYDQTLANYNRQLYRVLLGAENAELIYAVNASGAYNLNDYIAFSGGIAWATATLLRPEQYKSAVITVSYEDVERFCDDLMEKYSYFSDTAIANRISDPNLDKEAITKNVKTVNKVFDQRSMMAGAGLLLKIMRQFKSIYESKGFFLVKNGQVGWISAYVDQSVDNENLAAGSTSTVAPASQQ